MIAARLPLGIEYNQEMAKKKVDPIAAELGRRGGEKRAVNLSAAELSDIGKKGATARWGKKKKKPTKKARKK